MKKLMRVLGLTAAAAAATLGGMGGVAHAQGGAPGESTPGDGYVIARSGLNVRQAPTTHSPRSANDLPYQTTTALSCKVRGATVGGNSLWYLLPAPQSDAWISARYVENVGGVTPKWCSAGQSSTGKATASIAKHSGPTTSDPVVGSIAKGARVTITCKVTSQSVRGNDLWYYTSDGRWVSARYVANAGAAPGYCGK